MASTLGGITVGGKTQVRGDGGRFVSAAHEGAVRAAKALADEIALTAIILAPERSGALKGSIKAESHGVVGWATADAPYAEAQEKGAGPHDIPNSFGWGPDFGIGGRFGGLFHPGNPATHFLQAAGDIVRSYGASIVARYMP